jgi:hypothetical protein
MVMRNSWLLGLVAAALMACGSNSGGGTDGGGGGDDDGGGGSGTIDAPPFGGQCTVGGSQECSDCVDNDADGKIDGFDPECSGPADDREDSFATGIPGDNIDATDQDCFFDGNSGAGNDGCSQHVCCLLQAGGSTPNTNDDQTQCAMLAPNSNVSKYVRADCYQPFGSTAVPAKCKMSCGPLAPPGCDCFGCCTICDATGCRDLALNPQISPNCDQSNIHDPGADGVIDTADDPCKRCYKTDCGNTECGGQTCILCPGQDPSTLPSSCMGSGACPMDIMECDAMGNCPAQTYCSSGCCIGSIL